LAIRVAKAIDESLKRFAWNTPS
ncbi:MAG: hypothetical protein QOE68_2764, partial [Thermoanaerobaculia bacterium]|nr:hypothetical protein [Thermoanaerobaculia bacterium]